MELRGNSNYIDFDYTRNSHFGYIKNAEINADYSEFEIEEAENITLNADYTTSRFLKVANLNYSCDYGSLNIEKVRKISGSGDYLSTKIGRIFTSADISVDYGNLSIDKIIRDAEYVKIDSDYAGIKIGYDANHAFSFGVRASYGNITGLDDLEIRRRSEENTSKSIEGFHLNQNSGSQINVNTSYANIKFNKV